MGRKKRMGPFRLTNNHGENLHLPGIGRLYATESVDIDPEFWDEVDWTDREEIEETIERGIVKKQFITTAGMEEASPERNSIMPPQAEDRDVVLALNEYCFVLNRTNGKVNALVGPYKDTLDENKKLVVFNEDSKKFEPARLDNAVQLFDIAPEGWYAVMKNPCDGSKAPHPNQGVNEDSNLVVGQKVNIPGPVSFARYPGQMVTILPGHHLRSNEYLVCCVYDEKAAKESIAEAILKPQTDGDGDEGESSTITRKTRGLSPADMVMGKLLIIKGTDYSFFIPPTGIEVIAETRGDKDTFVRQAVTLEQLEYCVMLDEDGNKEYVYGPNVVFPKPTQKFLTKQGSDGKRTRKFRAIELNHLQGIYAKVIAEYTDEEKVKHEVGEELFITGGEGGQRIFKPRAEIAIISYGDSIKHYAIAIPEGEARYSLDRNTGEISVVKGPKMWLPDPRKEVPIRRVLSSGQVELLYPDNAEAQNYNAMLTQMMGGGSDFVTERAFTENVVMNESMTRGMTKKGMRSSSVHYSSSNAHALSGSDDHMDYEQASSEVVGDEFKRSAKYTKTPSITLDTKYEGVVTVDIWNNYAMLLVRKTGDRRVVVGPQTVRLAYDEIPEMLKLSKGKPKGTQPPIKTVYLRVKQNRVSDVITVQTADLVDCDIRVVYQLDFEGDNPEKWFDVEDYVKFITDNCRSRLRNAAKKLGIEEFHTDYIDIVRDTILGAQEDGTREGRVFPENACRIYEVDVLGLEIGNDEIARLLVDAQRDAVRDTLELRKQRRLLAVVEETEGHARKTAQLEAETKMQRLLLDAKEKEERDAISNSELERRQDRKQKELAGEQTEEDLRKSITEAVLAYKRLDDEFVAMQAQRKLDQSQVILEAETKSYVQRAEAIQSDLIASLQQLAATGSAEKIAEALGIPSYLNGESPFAMLHRLLAGTGLEKHLPMPPTNGGGKALLDPPSDLRQ